MSVHLKSRSELSYNNTMRGDQMTKEELATYSMEELQQMIDDAIQRSHIEFLKQLAQ